MDSIEAGVDSEREIVAVIAASHAVLVVVGPGGLDATDAASVRSLGDSDDFVGAETGAALGSGARVIPVLVGGAAMPPANDLPTPIAGPTRLDAIELTDRRWQADVQALTNLLERRFAICPRCGRENQR